MKVASNYRIVVVSILLLFFWAGSVHAEYYFPRIKPAQPGKKIDYLGVVAKFKPDTFTDEMLTNIFFLGCGQYKRIISPIKCLPRTQRDQFVQNIPQLRQTILNRAHNCATELVGVTVLYLSEYDFEKEQFELYRKLDKKGHMKAYFTSHSDPREACEKTDKLTHMWERRVKYENQYLIDKIMLPPDKAEAFIKDLQPHSKTSPIKDVVTKVHYSIKDVYFLKCKEKKDRHRTIDGKVYGYSELVNYVHKIDAVKFYKTTPYNAVVKKKIPESDLLLSLDADQLNKLYRIKK